MFGQIRFVSHKGEAKEPILKGFFTPLPRSVCRGPICGR